MTPQEHLTHAEFMLSPGSPTEREAVTALAHAVTALTKAYLEVNGWRVVSPTEEATE